MNYNDYDISNRIYTFDTIPFNMYLVNRSLLKQFTRYYNPILRGQFYIMFDQKKIAEDYIFLPDYQDGETLKHNVYLASEVVVPEDPNSSGLYYYEQYKTGTGTRSKQSIEAYGEDPVFEKGYTQQLQPGEQYYDYVVFNSYEQLPSNLKVLTHDNYRKMKDIYKGAYIWLGGTFKVHYTKDSPVPGVPYSVLYNYFIARDGSPDGTIYSTEDENDPTSVGDEAYRYNTKGFFSYLWSELDPDVLRAEIKIDVPPIINGIGNTLGKGIAWGYEGTKDILGTIFGDLFTGILNNLGIVLIFSGIALVGLIVLFKVI